MPAGEQELERDLGLVSVVAISMGAMIGSGIFVLPGIAMAEAGPAVVLAFVFAGILVLPAAVSISELGTAMPEAGGDYVFIERGMGPAAGTIAGLGTWLMLMFKGALALVGGMWYVQVIVSLPNYQVDIPGLEVGVLLPGVEILAITIGVILILVNIVGVKQTGGLQTIMVAVMVVILAGFVGVSVSNVDGGQFAPFFAEGGFGFIAATATVLISYGGVTKVAAVAEEIENPGRNLPLGLLLSLGVTTLLYALIVFVLVGVVEPALLEGSNVPMVDGIEPFFGTIGVVLIVLAALLALVSTANAGILTASRYPFALSRDKLLPAVIAHVNPRLHTPVIAILITGGAMLVIIVALPVADIAKTAGAFQIVVYVLVNVALIAFRVRDPAWYDPIFESPLYPWLQVFGIVSGIAILSQMDTLPLIGGVGIVIVGFLFYLAYGRQRVTREGIISEAVAESIAAVPESKERPYRIVVSVANPGTERGLMRLGGALISQHEDAELIPVNVITVPDQTALAQEIAFEQERIDRQQALLDDASAIADEFGVGVRTHAVVGRDVDDVLLDIIRDEQADEVLLGWKGERKRRYALGSIIDPVVERAQCQVSVVKQGSSEVGDIVAFVGGGPYSEPTLRQAGALLRSENGTTLTVVTVMEPRENASEAELVDQGEAEITELAAQVGLEPSEVATEVRVSEDVEDELMDIGMGYDTVCIGATRSTTVERALFGTLPERLGAALPATVLIVRSREGRRITILEAIRERLWLWSSEST